MVGWIVATGWTCLAALPQSPPAAPTRIDDPAALAEWIDQQVEAGLAAAGLTPAPLIDDALWLRRLSIDVRGVAPSGAEVAAFLADRDPMKRAARIDAFLESPEFAAHQASLWANLLAEGTTAKEGEQARMWLEPWLRQQFATHAALGPLTREVIAAASDDNEPGPAAYALIYRDTIDTLSGLTARHFLGLQIQCSQCHDDPYERFTQQQYNRFTAFFSDLTVDSLRGQSKMGRQFRVRDLPPEKRLHEELRRLTAQAGAKAGDGDGDGGAPAAGAMPAAMHGGMNGGMNGDGAPGSDGGKSEGDADSAAPAIPTVDELMKLLAAPDHGMAWCAENLQLAPIAEGLMAAVPAGATDELQRCIDVAAWRVTGHLDGRPHQPKPGETRRAALADWMVAPDNPWFGRNMANRIWAHVMGRGLHEPVDDLMAKDDRVLPALLEQLAREFHAGGTSFRRLAAALLRTRTYARGPSPAAVPKARRADERHFGAHPLRPLSAEQMLATLVQLRPELGRGEENERRVAYSALDRRTFEMKRFFGQVEGAGRGGADASILQALYLMNNVAARPSKSVRASPAAEQFRDVARPLDERLAGLWLDALSRLPTAAEVAAVTAAFSDTGAGAPARNVVEEQFDALFWALVNSAEFHTNR
ncbi:MAG: DUF1549 domain-containing protein [Planctomycetes bacterium]|nr:DUF1549 domain-containing protein [Planctomycetota bacterium]